MTTPIERAAAAIDENYNPDQAPILAAMFQDYARAAYEAIDTDELAHLIAEHLAAASGWPGRGDKMLHNATPIALAVKNWLTGKDQP